MHRWRATEANVLHGEDTAGVRVDTPDSGYRRGGFHSDGRGNVGVPYKWGQVAIVVTTASACLALWYLIDGLQVWWVEALLILTYVIVLYGTGVVRRPGKALKAAGDSEVV